MNVMLEDIADDMSKVMLNGAIGPEARTQRCIQLMLMAFENMPEATIETLITEFHVKFGLHMSDKPSMVDQSLFKFKLKHIDEEVAELKQSIEEKDLEAILDAIVDIVYVTIGLAVEMGLPFTNAFALIHRANMRKHRAPNRYASPRDSKWDVVKGPGWKKANLKKLLGGKDAKTSTDK